jgi:hypothetical protein
MTRSHPRSRQAVLILAAFISNLSLVPTGAFAHSLVTGNPDGTDQFLPEQPRIPDRRFNLEDFGAVSLFFIPMMDAL